MHTHGEWQSFVLKEKRKHYNTQLVVGVQMQCQMTMANKKNKNKKGQNFVLSNNELKCTTELGVVCRGNVGVGGSSNGHKQWQ